MCIVTELENEIKSVAAEFYDPKFYKQIGAMATEIVKLRNENKSLKNKSTRSGYNADYI